MMIRKATEGDMPQIQLLMESVPGFWHKDWRDDVLERGIRAADGLASVWKEGERINGSVCAHDVGFLGYLTILVVAEEVRGREVRKRLVRRVERELAARGCAVLISDVWKDAEGFYRALGWTSPDVVLLRRRLSGANS
jgi:GNAT superfamily N-acetyltransferase